MKKILLKTVLLFTVVLYNCKTNSQIIINMSGDNITYPSGYLGTGEYYIKDVNNNLNNFVGTWEYVNGNEKFQIILTKVIKYHVVHPNINLNYYEDGLTLQYKKFNNNVLTFESIITNIPTLESSDGIDLKGHIIDYGRVTKTIYYPQIMGGGVRKQGGEYFHPNCIIEKLPYVKFQPQKIKFNLYMQQSCCGETNNEIYNGLPTFSIPTNIEMVKI